MSVQSLSQTQRVLRLALSHGETGICQVDFLAPNVADGGKPITRLAARVHDLEGDGLVFLDGGVRYGTKVYILDRASLAEATKLPESGSPATDLSSSRVADDPESGALFEMPAPAPVDAIRGEAAA